MKFRLARKIMRRKRPVRFATAMTAMSRLEQRSRRWRGPRGLTYDDVLATPNKRPSFTTEDLLCNLPIEVL